MESEIIAKILAGQLVIMPTDTTYGIICDATNDAAVKKVYEVKRREYTKPLIILVSDEVMLNQYVKKISPLTQKIMQKYWPGPLSILFLKNEHLSKFVSANEYVAVRIPKDETLRKLIAHLNRPIVATSANISGDEVITTVNEVSEELKKAIPTIVDGGILTSVPSTLIKVEKEEITILRAELLAENIKHDFQDYIKTK